MAYANDITRRSLFTIAGAALLLPPVPPVALSTVPLEWRGLVGTLSTWHPNAVAVLQKAITFGVDPSSFSGITLHQAGVAEDRLPIVYFGERKRSHVVVSPMAGYVVTVFH